jgi:galactose oxidase
MQRFAVLVVGISASCAATDDMVDDREAVVLASEVDYFTAPMTITDATGTLLRPVHVDLRPDGRVLMIGIDGNAGLLAPSGAIADVQLAAVTAPVEVPPYTVFENRYAVADLLFCSGHTQLADGSFFSVGGSRWIVDTLEQQFYISGLSYGTRFDGTSWTRTAARLTEPGPTLGAVRWYPQATRLPDGKVLVTSGYDLPIHGPVAGDPLPGTRNISAELYDPATQTFAPLTDSAHTPVAVFNPDYSHVFVLPYPGVDDAYVLGESSAPIMFGTAKPGTWEVRLVPRPGTTLFGDGTARVIAPNYGASSVMLPLRLAPLWGYQNGSALVAGGAFQTPNEHSIDIYDPIANGWSPRLDMEVRRHHPSTVLLPDSRVLVIAGHDDSGTSGARVRHATYVDPAAGFRLTEGIAEMAEVRGYHTVTLLLPDGRVLVGGGRTAGANSPSDEKATFRYYYPGYMFRLRPAIVAAPSELHYGQAAAIAYTGQVTEVVLIGLGSMTHSFDSNQRSVQLVFGGNAIIAPPNAETAPPGYYMMFAVDANRTPSVARIVRVSP